MAVGVQVEAQGIIAVAGKRIFLHETRRDRIVHPCVQVIEPCLRIVLVACVQDVIGKDAGLIKDIAESVVVIGGGNRACGAQKRCDIRVTVVHVEECIHADLSGQQVDAIDIAAGLVSQDIDFEYDSLVLVQVSGQAAVHGFTDTQAVSVIGIDYGDSAGCYCGDELVKEVVGIGQICDRCLEDAVDRCGTDFRELVTIVVVGVDDGFRRDTVQLLFGAGQAVQGVVGIGGYGSIRSDDNGLGCAVAGWVVGVGCDFSGWLGYGGKAVQDVIGIGCDSAAVCFRDEIVRGIVGVGIGVDDCIIGLAVDEGLEEIVGGISIVFSGAVAVEDGLQAAVVVVGVCGGHAVGGDCDEAAERVVDLEGDVALGVGGGLGGAARGCAGRDVVDIVAGSNVRDGLKGCAVQGIVGAGRRAGSIGHGEDIAVIVIDVADGKGSHGLRKKPAMNVIDVGSRAGVAVGLCGKLTVGCVSV